MRRVLLTGMSGTGKSAVVDELRTRGYRAVDLDCDEYSHRASADDAAAGPPLEPGRDWVWREDRVGELLAHEDGEILFVSGCAANMGAFLPRFDHIVLLRAPVPVIVERLAWRRCAQYGTRPDEVARVLELIDSVEPLLRRAAGHEVDTSARLEEVVDAVLQIAHV
jgi:shikimate kinase